MRLFELECIGPGDCQKLAQCDITTCEQLLDLCGSPAGRARLSSKTGVASERILKWVSRADISRIRGIDGRCVDLLAYVGLDTAIELAEREPRELYRKLHSVNEAKQLVWQLPDESQVGDWIRQALGLQRIIYY